MPALQIATFPASEAYLADNTILDEGFKDVIKYEGCINIYHGVQTEDPKIGVYVIAWEKYEDHTTLMQRADFPDLIAKLTPAFAGLPVIVHFTSNEGVGDTVYSAPVAEFAIWKLKEGRTEEEFRPELAKLVQRLDNAKGTHPPGVYGKCIEDEKTFYVTVGWESMQVSPYLLVVLECLKLSNLIINVYAHGEAVSPQEVKDFLAGMIEIADLQIFHASLKKFSP